MSLPAPRYAYDGDSNQVGKDCGQAVTAHREGNLSSLGWVGPSGLPCLCSRSSTDIMKKKIPDSEPFVYRVDALV